MRRLGEVGVGLPVRIAATPLVCGQGVGEDDVLLDLGPAHADAGVTAQAPAHVFCKNELVITVQGDPERWMGRKSPKVMAGSEA